MKILGILYFLLAGVACTSTKASTSNAVTQASRDPEWHYSSGDLSATVARAAGKVVIHANRRNNCLDTLNNIENLLKQGAEIIIDEAMCYAGANSYIQMAQYGRLTVVVNGSEGYFTADNIEGMSSSGVNIERSPSAAAQPFIRQSPA